jgi:hypothetical protein
MAYSARTRTIGQSELPTAELARVNAIVGRSLAKGDAADASEATITGTNPMFVGWRFDSAVSRFYPVLYLPLPADIRRNARVIRATLYLMIVGSAWLSDIVPEDTDDTSVDVWAIRRTLSSSLTGLTAQNYTTGSAWDEYMIRLGVGSDVDPEPVASFAWTQDDHDANPSTASPLTKQLEMRAELEWLLATDEPLQLAFTHNWANTGVTSTLSTSKTITLQHPLADGDGLHTYLRLLYRNPIELYGSTADAKPDQTKLLDVASASYLQHIFAGTPPRGAASAITRFFVRNEISSSQRAVVLITARARIGSVKQVTTGSTGRLRYPRVFDAATGEGTPSGTWRFTLATATTANITFRPDGSDTFANTNVSPHTGVDITTDLTITYATLDALSIPAAAWTGTFAAADVVEFDTVADLHTTERPLTALEDFRFAPHAVGVRGTALSTSPRVGSRMRATQLYGHDASVIANTGGETGVIGNVSGDGANDGTHIKVPDTSLFTEDDYATLANYISHDEPEVSPTRRLEHCRIKTVYAMDDAEYPGQLGLYETIATPNDFDANAIFTTGVWAGTLEAGNQFYLATTASTASNQITLDTEPTRTSGTMTLLDLATGTKENRVISDVDGAVVTFTLAPSYAYPAGSAVFFEDETSVYVPWYAWAEPALDAERGRKQGYLSAASWTIT